MQAQGSDLSLTAVAAVFGYPKSRRLANITWVDRLLKTNRGRLYESLVKCVVGAVKEAAKLPAAPSVTLQPFEVVRIAGDGRCGWRAILACANLESFLAVPRCGVQRVLVWPSLQTFHHSIC